MLPAAHFTGLGRLLQKINPNRVLTGVTLPVQKKQQHILAILEILPRLRDELCIFRDRTEPRVEFLALGRLLQKINPNRVLTGVTLPVQK
jgi:hypothetical protein